MVHGFELVLLLSQALSLEAFLSFYKEEKFPVRWITERVVSIKVLLGLAENKLYMVKNNFGGICDFLCGFLMRQICITRITCLCRIKASMAFCLEKGSLDTVDLDLCSL